MFSVCVEEGKCQNSFHCICIPTDNAMFNPTIRKTSSRSKFTLGPQ